MTDFLYNNCLTSQLNFYTPMTYRNIVASCKTKKKVKKTKEDADWEKEHGLCVDEDLYDLPKYKWTK